MRALMRSMLALLLAVILATTIAAPARADGFDDFVHARRMRKAGAGLMSVGLIHLGVGLAMTLALVGMQAQCAGEQFPCDEGAGFLALPTIGLLAVGGALTAIGVPLFAVGRHRERWLLQALTPTPMGQLTPVPPMPQ
jgi:hypothetical protein